MDNIVLKDATITNTDDEFPGSFEVILSAPTEDRDGETLLPEDWKQPLPDHITFDTDHGMSVAATVGSGVPEILGDGRLKVAGTYSSLPRAQETRTLVKEGHIRTTSVAFLSSRSTKGGKTKVTRELLNGAFVAIPSNREAVVLSAKEFAAKAGARHSKADADHVQAIHDHAVALGATAAGAVDTTQAEAGAVGGKDVRRMAAAKAVAGSYEEREQAISDALSARYPGDDMWAYSLATFDDSVVYRVSGGSDLRGQWQCDYTVDDGGVVTLGEPTRVNKVEQYVPVKNYVPDGDVSTEAADDTSADAAATAAASADEKSAAADADIQVRAARIRALASLSLEGEI
ncbi:hypothetical protein SAMN05444157_1617 [Frankineae bacterium MT45]|nr:hypothetical protein SAMN05444157_1617 [Frankineae bacterium MT45]